MLGNAAGTEVGWRYGIAYLRSSAFICGQSFLSFFASYNPKNIGRR